MYAILFKSQKKYLGDSPVGRMFDDHAQISEFNPSPNKTVMVLYFCKLCTCWAKAGESAVQHYPWFHSELKGSLGYM